MPKHQTWTEAELARMKKVVETSGLSYNAIATRFGCGVATVQDLTKKYGWAKKPTGENA